MTILIVILLFLLLRALSNQNKANKEIASLKQMLTSTQLELENLSKSSALVKIEKIKLLNELKDLQLKLSRLSKYESLLNIEDKANEIINEANEIYTLAKVDAENIANEAQSTLSQAKVDAKQLKAQANEECSKKLEKYDFILSTANDKANEIIKVAQENAKEIAGDAYYAKENLDEIQQTIKAINNTIKGYGNEYLVPSTSILDELSETYGFTEAGNELSIIRVKIKDMVKNKQAATCEYVEQNRRDTAINFVTDAFNGKVDSILSTVKEDNYGKLEQKIKDAFYIVNNLGKAFKNASITENYLHTRLEELKWAVAVMELKNKEKEEQRAIKEQIREEERARKEYEKAIKEAEKEEAMLNKLKAQLQNEFDKASENEKAKYANKLADLEEKLKIAEEKNQRAISMAQQTKSGHIYVISNIGSFGEDVYKIGMTRRLEPTDRVKELGDASVPFSFDIHAMIFSEDAPKLETELHRIFKDQQVNKVNPRKEFFKLDIHEIKSTIERLGINAKWTLKADAKEYYESLSMNAQLIS